MKVAYLAPEIPSLSGTFVYHEMLALQQQNISVISLSVHYPANPAQEKAVQSLLQETHYLYQRGMGALLKASLGLLLKAPGRYLHTLGHVLSDIRTVGLFSRQTSRLLYQFITAGLVADILLREQCTHLHIHFAHVPTQIGMYAAMLAAVPFSFMSHANDLFERGLLLQTKAERAKAAVTISDYNRLFLLQQGVSDSHIHIVRCGINTHSYTFQPHPLDADKPLLLGSIGRLVEKKGFDVLLRALHQLHKNGFKCRLELAGDGPEKDNLRQLAADLALDDIVDFKGALSHDRVLDWMRHLDLFVLACKPDRNGDQDGIPVVLMEAMAVGTPVISTRISGIPELIEHEISGYLATPDDADDLADQIRTLTAQPRQLPTLVQQARLRVETEFDQTVNIQRLINIFGS